MPKNSSRFFCNRDCQYFPCHENVEPDNFNCLFCFCPLYFHMDCGGAFTLTSNGKKDCAACIFPHKAENYGAILKKLKNY